MPHVHDMFHIYVCISLAPPDGDNLIKTMSSPPQLSRSDPLALHTYLTHLMSLNVTPTYIRTHPIMFQSMVVESARQRRPIPIIMAQLAALMTFDGKEHLPTIAQHMTSTSTSTSTSPSQPKRILILHGDEDRVIPVENSRLLSSSLSSCSEYIEMKQMGHVFWSMDETNEAARILRAFLVKHDSVRYPYQQQMTKSKL